MNGTPGTKTALIIVDVQCDFIEGGPLAVPGGGEVVSVANRMMPLFDFVVATQDWHPPDHQSFASQHDGIKIGRTFDLHGLPQIAWPDHCVQGTRGADFVGEMNLGGVHHVQRKGTDKTIDSYSAFFDNGHRRSTGLTGYLHEYSIGVVAVMGLATDYCVRFTALDSAIEGFRTFLVEDGCRGVDLQAGDVAGAIKEMEQAGVKRITSEQWNKR